MLKNAIKLILIMVSFVFASEQDVLSEIYLNINGHEHPLADETVREIVEYYLTVKDEMAAEKKGEKVEGYYIRWIKLGDDVDKFSYDRIDGETIKTTIKIDSNRAKLDNYIVGNPNTLIRWKTVHTIKFDLNIEITLKIHVENAEIFFIITKAEYKLKRVHLDGGFSDAIAHLFNGFKSISFQNSLSDYEGDTTSVFNFFDMEATTVVNGANQQDEIDALGRSLPIEVNPVYLKKPSPKLLLDIKFLHQYYEDDGITLNKTFESFTPSIPVSNSLSYCGFSYMHWGGYDCIEKDNSSLTNKEERFDVLINKMEDMGLNHLRTEAVWSKIVPTINSVSASLHPSQIADVVYSGDSIDAYIAQINSYGGWDTLDHFINSMDLSSVITEPYIVVGCGHSSRPPIYVNNGDSLRIAPGTVRGNSSNEYLGVPENVYLYWLKKYARAVVRRYKDKINFWQIENELNAARFTESFGWWRKGDAWAQDYAGGFQDKVIELLYDAVKLEDSDTSTKILTSFHVLNSAKRIKEWNKYCDIIGLQIYPHLFHAYPVLGFITGEYVWAAKRILESEGTPNKEVWITETGYPAKTNDAPPDDFIQNIFHFSQVRQQQYLEDAISSCVQNGASGFNWFRMYSEEEDDASNEIEEANCYAGFFDVNNNQKLALPVYENTFAANNNLDSVTFFTKTLNNEDLSGSFHIASTVNYISSGKSVRLIANRPYDVSVNKQFLLRLDSSVVQHYQWNDEANYKLVREYNSSSDLNIQYAKYNDVYPVSFNTSVAEGIDTSSLTLQLKIQDPWYNTTYKNQPNRYYELGFSVDTTIYNVFLNQNIIQGDPYYKIKAPKIGGTTTDNIYVFDHWSGSGVNIVSPNNRETAVVFQNTQGMNLTAHYSPVLNIPNFTLVVPEDEILEIPAGSNYTFPQGFSIECFGNFNIHGTPDAPVLFNGAGKEEGFEPYVGGPQDTLILILGNNSINDLNNVQISNVPNAIFIDAVDAQLTIQNSSFEGNNVAISIGEIENCVLKMNNLQFKSNDVGISFGRSISDANQTSSIGIAYSVFDSTTFHSIFAWPEEVTQNSDLNIGIYHNNFINSGISTIYHKVVGSTSCEFRYEIYNNIFYKSNCSVGDGLSIHSGHNIFYEVSNPGLPDVIVDNPEFISIPNKNYHLSGNSPCIDMADSLEGMLGYPDFENLCDPDGTCPDIGAYYYPQLSGTLSLNTTLSGACRIIDDLEVPQGIELTIEPGTTVKLEPDADINVYGKFTAQGTAENPILFTTTVVNPTTSDYWGRIYFKDDADDNSILEYCNMKYADYGAYIYRSNPTVNHCNIGPVYIDGICVRYAAPHLTNNTIQNSRYGIFYLLGNDIGPGLVQDNTIQNCDRGMYIYRSSPYILGNLFQNNTYGVYCNSYASPYFGTYDYYGNNDFYENEYGLYAVVSSPFLGRDMCTINGGFNRFENNAQYHVYATSSSVVVAEKNWWGSYPYNSNDFYEGYNSSIDKDPALTSNPMYKSSSESSESSTFDGAFSTGDSSLTEQEAMANYNPDWPILRRLLYARNLNLLGFPQNTSDICNAVLKSYPDSAEAYFALDLLWQAGRGYTPEFVSYKSYLDSLASVDQPTEVYEEAELLLEDYEDESELAKRLNTYQKYSYPKVAARSLFRDFNYHLAENDFTAMQATFSIMENNYPDDVSTQEARKLLAETERIGNPGIAEIPVEYVLKSNYPNPFNPITHIPFGIPEVSNIQITIYNILGQKVRTLKQNMLNPGFHEITFNAFNSAGAPLASGLYVYRFQAFSAQGHILKYHKSGKFLLLK